MEKHEKNIKNHGVNIHEKKTIFMTVCTVVLTHRRNHINH